MADHAVAGLSASAGVGATDIYYTDDGTSDLKVTAAQVKTFVNTSPAFTGSVVVGSGALATNATTGFLYIPTCAGTPSGTPAAQTGTVAIVYDTTNHKLYIYDGAWKGGTVPGVWS
jgi:hypothetical protein